MTDLREIAQRSGRTAIDRGFEPPSWTNYPVKMMGVVTEIEEAIAALEAESLTDAGEELADIVLRATDMLETVWGADWSASRIEDREPMTRLLMCEPRMAFAPHMKMVWKSIQYWRQTLDPRDPARGVDTRIALELIVLETFRLADRLGVDLMLVMSAKLDYNAQRPKLHGKVQASF